MKQYNYKFYSVILLLTMILFYGCIESKKTSKDKIMLTKIDNSRLTYILPSPDHQGSVTVEEALSKRRSRRNFQDRRLSAEHLSQLLWAAYGITMPKSSYPLLRGGLRAAPSAGGLYPLEIYVLVGNVKGIEPGVYRYISGEHKIVRTIDKDIREDLCRAALNQKMIRVAPAVLFYSAVYSRCTEKYGRRGRERYVCMDLGHSAQNVYLQAEALHLGTCAIGAFEDDAVAKVMQLPKEEEPLYIMPVGYYYHPG